MTATEAISIIRENTNMSLAELVEYAELKSKSNACQLLQKNDMKVSTFVRILESMGYQLLVVDDNGEELLIDE